MGEPDLRTADDAVLATGIMAAPAGGARREESELCRRFARRVRLYGLRHLRSEARADDLVQRVLMITLEKLRARSVEKPDKIASFVLGTARLIAREMTRGDHREQPLPPDLIDLVPSDERSRETEPRARERLAQCLQTLDERARAVLILTFFDEQEPDEIAAALSVSKGNVRVIRHRAVSSLRECMDVAAEVA